MRLRRAIRSTPQSLAIRAYGDRVAAGEAIVGDVLGCPGLVDVELVRVERTPSGLRLIPCLRTVALAAMDVARFELALPEELVPSGRGRECAVAYAVRAVARGGAQPAMGWATIEVVAGGRPHLEPHIVRFDRFIASFPGRRFHIELSDAELTGGGHIAGRLHRDGDRPLGPVAITLSATESWRLRTPCRGGSPQWRDSVLWTATVRGELCDERAWAPFRFDIPAGLPDATEAHAIAWRYELTARRRMRHLPQPRAALTPLLFEAA